MAELIAPAADAEFHYSSREHQADTAIAGMWLFLATEVLFFGGIVFVWTVLARAHSAGFALAVSHTNLLIGSLNTALLITSSAVCTWGAAASSDPRRVTRAFTVTAALGVGFLVLKGVEWSQEFGEHLFPGASFALHGGDAGGAQLFYALYFIATGLHAIHMMIGLGLLGWVIVRARLGHFRPGHATPVEVVALYWSFVDLVWLTLYPLIYVVLRP